MVMELEIKKLTPQNLNDFLTFFETDAHADNPQEDRCYCVCWSAEDHTAPVDLSSPQARRALAVQYVQRGTLQGYLAYAQGRVVGWCNANTKADCQKCSSWLRFRRDVLPDAPGVRTKSVFCFTVAPAYRRCGVASQLLQRVCADAAAEGFDYAEAYPNCRFTNVFHDFVGPLSMYEKQGFVPTEKTKTLFVVRKPLKNGQAGSVG